MSNIEPSTKSSLSLGSRVKKLSWNVFKNSFLLPIFSIGLIGGSGYLFYTGEPEIAASLAGTAVAAITVNNKDDKDDKEVNERRKSILIDELQEKLAKSEALNQEWIEKVFEFQINTAVVQERLLNIQEKNNIEKELLEEKRKTALFEQEVRFLQQGLQQFRQLPEGKNQPFNPQIEEKVTEVQNPPDDSNIK